jgi:DNA replication protein DnaC
LSLFSPDVYGQEQAGYSTPAPPYHPTYPCSRLLILDEIGFRVLNPQALDDFFEIIRHRYECKSPIFTSNRNFEDWGAILGDKVMASAIIDRIVHHAHILRFAGESYRIKDFLTHLNNID